MIDKYVKVWTQLKTSRTLYLFKIGWAVWLLLEITFLWGPHFSFFFGINAPFQTTPEFDTIKFWNFFRYVNSDWVYAVAGVTLVISAFLVFFEKSYRLGVIISLYLAASFINLSPGNFFSYHAFWKWLGLVLLFAPQPNWSKEVVPTSVFFLRLIQAQFLVIYANSAISKLFSARWQNGTALDYAFSMTGYMSSLFVTLFNWLSLSAFQVRCLTYAVLIIEMSLPLFLILRKTRRAAVVGGILFHICIFLFMNIGFFQILMIIGLLTFWPWDGRSTLDDEPIPSK